MLACHVILLMETLLNEAFIIYFIIYFICIILKYNYCDNWMINFVTLEHLRGPIKYMIGYGDKWNII